MRDTQQTSGGLGQYVFLGVIVLLLLVGMGYFFGIFSWILSRGATPTVLTEEQGIRAENRPESSERPPIAAGSADVSDERLVALGRSIYNGQCAVCHGAALGGQPDWKTRLPNGLLPAPPHDDSGHTWHHSDATLFGVTKFGVAEFNNLPEYETAMPVYKDVLSDEEIWAVLTYIKSRWSKKSLRFHNQVDAQDTGN